MDLGLFQTSSIKHPKSEDILLSLQGSDEFLIPKNIPSGYSF